MATTNFLPWNSSENNQETDAQYLVDSLRVNGAVSDALLASVTDNKFRFQVAAFVAAFAQMMVNKGFTINDNPFSTLVAALSNVLTTADVTSSIISVSYASSVAFNGLSGHGFDITLTGNVAASTLTNPQNGLLIFIIQQDSAGGRTFVWPSQLTPTGLICSLPNSVSVQPFAVRPGGGIVALGPMVWITANGFVLQPTSSVIGISTSGTVSNGHAEITEEVNCSGGNVTRSLYSAAGMAGFEVTIKRAPGDTSTNLLMIQPLVAGQTIDGFPNYGPISPYGAATFQCDGSNWILKSNYQQGSGVTKQQVFNASGTFTPSTALLENGGWVKVEVAGGGGGGSASEANITGGSGGGGGKRIVRWVQVTGPVPVTVGAGGSGGTPSAGPGGAGGTSSFGTLATAPGGSGGTISSGGNAGNSSGGPPAAVSGGGGDSGPGGTGGPGPGGVGTDGVCGGGGAGNTGGYGNASAGSSGGGSGGNSAIGNNAQPNSGSGGGGGGETGSTAFAGGNGGSGYVLVTWQE